MLQLDIDLYQTLPDFRISPFLIYILLRPLLSYPKYVLKAVA